jgi:hypothetical protein
MATETPNVMHIESNELDYDAQRLHDLGYKQEFSRSLDMFVQFGFAFSTMAVLPSWRYPMHSLTEMCKAIGY